MSHSENGMLPASASNFDPILKKMPHSSSPAKVAVCGTKHTAFQTYDIPERTLRLQNIVAVSILLHRITLKSLGKRHITHLYWLWLG